MTATLKTGDVLTLVPPPDGNLPATSRDQRRTIRECCAFLRSDLFDRTGGSESSAVWSSPLGWAVEYGGMADSDRVWARVYRGWTGEVVAETTDVSVEWLDEMVP